MREEGRKIKDKRRRKKGGRLKDREIDREGEIFHWWENLSKGQI